MADGTSLEDLLRSVDLTYGNVTISVMNGEWGATVCHFGGRATMTHHMGDLHSDPVDALRTALIEDARKGLDVKRRYAAASKLGEAARAPLPAAAPDMDDVLG